MAGAGGYFLKGLAGGLETGFNMGWQKKQQKKLEAAQAKIKEGSGVYFNLISQLGADGTYSEDDISKLNTAFLAAGYEVQGVIKDAHNAIMTMDKNKFERDIQWLDVATGLADGLDPKNATEIFNYFKDNFVTCEKGKNLFTAYDSAYAKKYEAMQAQPEDVWGQAEKLPQDIRSEYLRSKGVEIPEKEPTVTTPKIGDLDSAFGALSKYINSPMFNSAADWVADTFKIDRSILTKEASQEWLNQKTATPDRATSLPQLEKYRQDIKDADTIKEARRLYKNYADEYDEEQLGIDDVDKYWAEGQTEYLNNINIVLKNLIDEKGWLKKGTMTKDEVGVEFTGERTVEEIYKEIRKSYMQYRDMLEEMGVDISQFPKLKPLAEIEKVGFGEGFWGAGKQRGQFKSIYY